MKWGRLQMNQLVQYITYESEVTWSLQETCSLTAHCFPNSLLAKVCVKCNGSSTVVFYTADQTENDLTMCNYERNPVTILKCDFPATNIVPTFLGLGLPFFPMWNLWGDINLVKIKEEFSEWIWTNLWNLHLILQRALKTNGEESWKYE